jgi:hypothetical protein
VKRFEDKEPANDDGVDAQSPLDTRHAFLRPVDAGREIRDTVAVARAEVSLGDDRCDARHGSDARHPQPGAVLDAGELVVPSAPAGVCRRSSGGTRLLAAPLRSGQRLS